MVEPFQIFVQKIQQPILYRDDWCRTSILNRQFQILFKATWDPYVIIVQVFDHVKNQVVQWSKFRRNLETDDIQQLEGFLGLLGKWSSQS